MEHPEALAAVLRDVRHFLTTQHLQALIVTHADAHASEYISERDERLAFVSGFTGSAGTALVTLDKALLWTDGRYFTQAAKELSKDWELMRSGEKDVPTLENYLADLAGSWNSTGDQIRNGDLVEEAKRRKQQFTVAVDAEFVSIKLCEKVQAACESIDVQLVMPSIVNRIWDQHKTRPLPKPSSITLLPLAATGRTVQDKIVSVTTQLKAKKCDAIVISALDDIAWLLNARGAEIPFNPVFFAHLVITPESDETTPVCTVYTDHDLSEYSSFVRSRPYGSFYGEMPNLFSSKNKIWIDPNTTSAAFLQSCTFPSKDRFKNAVEAAHSKLYQANTCIKLEKPKKTAEEITAMKRAQIADGAAVCKFLAFVSRIPQDNHLHDEYSLAQVLDQYRKRESPNYAGNSFETISSFGENGAIIHYKPKPKGSAKIEGSNVYLCDSGGHYSFGGTTDTTRTIWLGDDTSSDLFKDARQCYTYVLKAHIALASMSFPSGIAPSRLDSIPRAQLWAAGLDYNHGTGHGVGSWLCVHELPPLISSVDTNLGGIVPGMCVTNEPGYYVEGKFGFRIENLMLVEQDPENAKFCKFNTVTFVPYSRALTDPTLLTADEIAWVNQYHLRCRDLLQTRLEGTEAFEWFMQETATIELPRSL